MQTEETIGNGEYHSTAIEVATLNPSEIYPFDAPEVQFQIPRGKAMLTVVLQKPELENYLNMEKASRAATKIVDGAMIDPPDTVKKRHTANEDFFDGLVLRAFAIRKGESKPFAEFDAEQCRSWEFEPKDDAVIRFSNQSSFTLEIDDDDLGLFEKEGTLRVKQIVGDESNPSYVIFYDMKPLPKFQRLDYESAVTVKRKFDKGGLNLETEAHLIKKAMKLFAPNFQNVEGGMIGGRAYTAERRDDFIQQIDPMFQFGVVDCLISYYRNGSRD